MLMSFVYRPLKYAYMTCCKVRYLLIGGVIGEENPTGREAALHQSSDDEVGREDMARMLAEAAAERTARRRSKREAKRREKEEEEQEGQEQQGGGHYVNLGRSRVFVRDNSMRATEV